MFERLSGIWFGLGVIIVWSMICALLLVNVRDGLLLGVVAVMWLVVVVPTAWGIRRSSLR